MASFANHFILRQIEFIMRAAILQLRENDPFSSERAKKRSVRQMPPTSSPTGSSKRLKGEYAT